MSERDDWMAELDAQLAPAGEILAGIRDRQRRWHEEWMRIFAKYRDVLPPSPCTEDEILAVLEPEDAERWRAVHDDRW
jgi:hypothetical protein